MSDEAKDLIRGLLVKEAPKRLSAGAVLQHPWIQVADEDTVDSVVNEKRRRALATPGIIRRNQSARELSQFAESAMAVKRVILQHFSMRYDYMTKERPNIYEPSSSSNQSKHLNNDSINNDENISFNIIKHRYDDRNDKTSENGCNKLQLNASLDSIMETKEKFLNNRSGEEENCFYWKKDNPNVKPEDNWRHRSASKSVDKIPLGFRNYRKINNNNFNTKNYRNQNQSNESGIEINNWRNECIYRGIRNCGDEGRHADNSDDNTSDECLGVGLSPPCESLLMQRRELRRRSSELMEILSPPATATASG